MELVSLLLKKINISFPNRSSDDANRGANLTVGFLSFLVFVCFVVIVFLAVHVFKLKRGAPVVVRKSSRARTFSGTWSRAGTVRWSAA